MGQTKRESLSDCRRKLPISSVRIKKFCATTQFDATKAYKNGFEAPYTIEEGLERMLRNEFDDSVQY